MDEKRSEPGGQNDTAAVSGAKVLRPAARRALEEAARRRAERDATAVPPSKEVGGRDGPDPARYGDWEVRGIVSDF